MSYKGTYDVFLHFFKCSTKNFGLKASKYHDRREKNKNNFDLKISKWTYNFFFWKICEICFRSKASKYHDRWRKWKKINLKISTELGIHLGGVLPCEEFNICFGLPTRALCTLCCVELMHRPLRKSPHPCFFLL